MTDRYILDSNGNPVPEPDLIKWAQWFGRADRRVAITEIGDAHISTVFLGLNHNFLPDPDIKPILFETMIFWNGHNLDMKQDRYYTRDEALIGHEAMVTRVRKALEDLKSRS